MEQKIKNVLLRIVRGDLLKQEVEVIVCPTSSDLMMMRGVAEVIKIRGGDSIQLEAESKGDINAGDVIYTSAGCLDMKYIFHAAIMGPDIRPEREVMKKALDNVLFLAESLKVKSISIPAFGTASSQFPYDTCGRIMLSTVIDYIQGKDNIEGLELIQFCLFNDVAYNAFVKTMGLLKEEYFLF